VAGGLLERGQDASFVGGQDDLVVGGVHVSFPRDLGCPVNWP
jgi:hypothetical protein